MINAPRILPDRTSAPRDPMKKHLPLCLLCLTTALAQQPQHAPTPPPTKPAPTAPNHTHTTTPHPPPPPPTPALPINPAAGARSYTSIDHPPRAAYTPAPLAEHPTASRDPSDGFIPDRNYSSNPLASETWLSTKPGTTDILLATSDRPYGASQFYGPYPSWERTKGWFAGIQQQLGQQTAASFGYRRHTDLFVLFVDQPAIYENNPLTTTTKE